LGLSISIGIIKGHNGFITVESVKGKGSIFKIFLPAVSTINASSQEVEFQPDLNQPIIFVACSENEYNHKLFNDLEDHGYETLLAVGKKEMRETLIQNLSKAQIVVFDGFSFDETPGLMRDTLKYDPKAKLIVMATRTQMDEMKASEAPKPHAVLEQPATIKLLLEAIQQPVMQEEPLI
jgi:two-component system, cell cycle sensor histidine kinase and response regulator CckA